MSLFNDLKKLVDKEKQKIAEKEKNDKELQERKAKLAEAQKEAEFVNNEFKKFRKNYLYGKVDEDDKNFTNVGNITFVNCLKKAYCQDLTEKDKKNGLCAHDEKFYPYLAWKQLETQPTKGTCLLGTEENDVNTFEKGNFEVFLTPIEQERGKITDNLNLRESKAKIKLIKRLQKSLDASLRNVLHSKNTKEIIENQNIKDNYLKLSNLDKSLLTMTQKIRQNNSNFIINDRVSNILTISFGVIAFIVAVSLIYFSIKYTRSNYNVS